MPLIPPTLYETLLNTKMLKIQKALLTNIVKLELKLNNKQYEIIYSNIEAIMQERGILGKQLRSIRAKTETRRLGIDVRSKHKDMLRSILDIAFNINIMRIA